MSKRVEVTIRIIDEEQEKLDRIQKLCKEYHELFSDKDDICPYCGKPINEDF